MCPTVPKQRVAPRTNYHLSWNPRCVLAVASTHLLSSRTRLELRYELLSGLWLRRAMDSRLVNVSRGGGDRGLFHPFDNAMCVYMFETMSLRHRRSPEGKEIMDVPGLSRGLSLINPYTNRGSWLPNRQLTVLRHTWPSF